jgi:hypothetical protein
MDITKSDAIKALHPDVPFSFINGQINIWESDQPQPTEEQIQAKLTELQNAEPMRLLREQRNQKLSETDWWCASDRTPTQAQLDYRTALRDLPSTASPSLDENGNLTNVTWPNKPE